MKTSFVFEIKNQHTTQWLTADGKWTESLAGAVRFESAEAATNVGLSARDKLGQPRSWKASVKPNRL